MRLKHFPAHSHKNDELIAKRTQDDSNLDHDKKLLDFHGIKVLSI